MSPRKSWSELPSELLTLISDRLGTRPDTCMFRLVCKVWRDSTSFSTCNKPLNILSPLLPYEFPVKEINLKEKLQCNFPVTLVPCSVFIVRSSLKNRPIWLCAVKESTLGKFKACQPRYKRYYEYECKHLPKSFNVAFFRVSEMGRSYTLKCDKILLQHVQKLRENKVVLISNPKFESLVDIFDYKAIVLDSNGNLRPLSIKHGIIDKMTVSNGVSVYDDLVNFQESIYTIDRKGRLYCMGYNDTRLKMVVSQPLGMGSGDDMKKRLVVDTSNNELYLIHRTPLYMKSMFKVYKMNFEDRKWDELVVGIGVDRILVVILDICFFATTKDIPGVGGNCMLFSSGDFRHYKYSTGENIAIYDTNVFSFQDGSCKNIGGDSYPRFWPPPAWLSEDTDKVNSLSIQEIVNLRSFHNQIVSESKCLTETCVDEAMLHMKDDRTAKPGSRLVHDQIPTIKSRSIINIDSFPDITHKASDSQGKFNGISVSSKLIPILEKIWYRYGNVMENNVMNSDEHMTWALESLAKVVILLLTKSIESLSESQAAFLIGTMKDLRLLRIRVDWLEGFVDKVVTVQKLKRARLNSANVMSKRFCRT